MEKTVLAIHDISCVGRCSLTVALPILSAAGLNTGVLPTAVLSTHTGGFAGFTYRDLTDDLTPISTHWQSMDLQFDTLYSGFLGSYEQIDLVATLFATHKKPGGRIVVDPVMADNGHLYSVYSQNMVEGMRRLCGSADLILPNLTEAAFLLGEDYVGEDYDQAYLEATLRKLGELGPNQVVLTGVSLTPGQLGAACYTKATNTITYVSNRQEEGHFHGTGDIFASALVSALENGFSLEQSGQIAVDFTLCAIQHSLQPGRDRRYGVSFEQAIPHLLKALGKV